jgi:hypothetical protein
MSIGTLIQLALGVLRLGLWITARIDRAEWQRSGHAAAVADMTAAMQRNVGIADAAVRQADAATPQQRKDILESDL